tara:strand:- start:353 stop:508 length:156 start_codon:yes stop_codon:yes gene_type:complete
MPKYNISYFDIIEADNIEDAYKRLLCVLASDVEHQDVDAFSIMEIDDVKEV